MLQWPENCTCRQLGHEGWRQDVVHDRTRDEGGRQSRRLALLNKTEVSIDNTKFLNLTCKHCTFDLNHLGHVDLQVVQRVGNIDKALLHLARGDDLHTEKAVLKEPC